MQCEDARGVLSVDPGYLFEDGARALTTRGGAGHRLDAAQAH